MTQGISPQAALQAAVDALGSQAALSRLCDVSQPSVFKWIKKGKPLPPQHVLKVEAATGISKHDLRPDIYPRDAGPHLPGSAAGTGAGGEQSTPARAEPTDSRDPLSGLTA